MMLIHKITTVASLILIGLAAESIQAQGVSSAASSMHAWRSTSRGMSTNAALAFYRVQNVGHPRQGNLGSLPAVRAPGTTIYSAPYYAITTHRRVTTPTTNYYPNVSPRDDAKPFSEIRPAPTAIDRYWPLLLEAREDRNTGLVIWTLP